MKVNPEYAAIAFCAKCFSNRVDIGGQEEGKAVFRCCNCGNETVVDGFTIGRYTGSGAVLALADAINDCALPDDPLPAVDPNTDDLEDLFRWGEEVARRGGITPEKSKEILRSVRKAVYQ